MKRRPQCDQTFNDAYFNFCLLDGTRLTIESEKQADEKIKACIQKENLAFDVRRILKTTLGFGGVNAAIVLTHGLGTN